MSDAELLLALDRIRQNRAPRSAFSNANVPTLAERPSFGGRQFLAGDRVFDPATALDGDVLQVTRPDGDRRLIARVQLSDGRIVDRRPDDLIGRPTPPAPATA